MLPRTPLFTTTASHVPTPLYVNNKKLRKSILPPQKIYLEQEWKILYSQYNRPKLSNPSSFSFHGKGRAIPVGTLPLFGVAITKYYDGPAKVIFQAPARELVSSFTHSPGWSKQGGLDFEGKTDHDIPSALVMAVTAFLKAFPI